MILEQYKINGVGDDLNGYCEADAAKFKDKNHYPDFQRELEDFQSLVIDCADRRRNTSFLRLSDGDYFFLKKEPHGSACPGNRALSIQYSQIDMDVYFKSLARNDFFGLPVFDEFTKQGFSKDFPQFTKSFSLEFLYGLLSSKWFFKQPNFKIGLIGGENKMEVIRQLSQKKEYLDYLGIEKFYDYITVPEKFACDDLDTLDDHVEKQLKKSTANIFLFGVGHVKLYLSSRFKDFKEAVYLDVGTGIDALAGIQEYERPYFSNWQNFRLKNVDYSQIDMMQSSLNGKEIWLD